MTNFWDKHAGNDEYAAVDYLDKLPALEPWAPYNWYRFGEGPYDYVRGQHLSSYVTARQVLEFLDERLGKAKRPRLFAFPFGTFEGATQPEALSFEFLTYYLNGYSGAFAYLFPGGYDGRYWRALAEMNRQMALLEPYTVGACPEKKHTLACQTPMPMPDPRFFDAACGDIMDRDRWRNTSLLQSWEFEKGNTRLIAVGNFWEKGECFFRLSPAGLDPRTRYVLHEPAARRVYTDASGRVARIGSELSKGVLLHVGAMRCAFFVLEPYRHGVDYGAPVRPQGMQTEYNRRHSGSARTP